MKRLTEEIDGWSDHVLMWLLREEDITDEFRAVATSELERRRTAQVDMVTLTRENLAALFNNNAPNAAQVQLLKLGFLRKGWLDDLVGTEMPEDTYRLALSLKGARPKGASRAEWRRGRLKVE